MKNLTIAALLIGAALLVGAAHAQTKGLTATVENPSTGVSCTHWRITSDQRDHVSGTISVTLGGWSSAALRAADKQPSCSQQFTLLKADLPAGKSVDVVSLADMYAAIKVKSPGIGHASASANPTPPPPPVPVFKDAKIE